MGAVLPETVETVVIFLQKTAYSTLSYRKTELQMGRLGQAKLSQNPKIQTPTRPGTKTDLKL